MTTTGFLIGICGPPKTGKSTTLRSSAKLGKTAVALTDPDEAAFYREVGIEPEVFFDKEWSPQDSLYEATEFGRYMRWLGDRLKDDTEFVHTDTGNGVSNLAMHANLRANATDNPKDVPYGAGYTGHDRLMQQVIDRWKLLVLKGKVVGVSWHVKMKEMEGLGDAVKVKSMDKDASGNQMIEREFDEQLMPVVPTSFRQVIPGHFPIWLFTKPAGYGNSRKYNVTALPDEVRPAACRFALDFAPLADKANPAQSPTAGRFPNDLGVLLRALGRSK